MLAEDDLTKEPGLRVSAPGYVLKSGGNLPAMDVFSAGYFSNCSFPEIQCEIKIYSNTCM